MAPENESSSSCYYHYNTSDIEIGTLINGIPGLVCFSLTIFGLVTELIFLCRIKNSFLLRLFVYLSITIALSVGVSALRLVELLDTDYHSLCETFFVMDRYGQNVRMILIVSINITLLHKVFTNTIWSCRVWLRRSGELTKNTIIALEVLFVVAHLAIPAIKCVLVIALLPHSDYWIPWGLCQSGRTAGKDCDSAIQATDLQFTIEIVVLGGIDVVLCLTSVVTLIVCLCWLQRKHYVKKQMSTVVKEMVLFLGFLITYCLSWMTIVSLGKVNHDQIQLATFSIYPISYLVLPISFFVYMSANLCPSCSKQTDDTLDKNLMINPGLDAVETSIRLSEASEHTPILPTNA